MRLFLMLLIMLLVFGCSSTVHVSMINATHNDTFDSSKNMTIDKISFILKNDNPFDVSCDVSLIIDNATFFLNKTANVGMIAENKQMNVSISFIMPAGESSIELKPLCERVE